MTLDAHVTGIRCGQIGGGVGNVRKPPFRPSTSSYCAVQDPGVGAFKLSAGSGRIRV